jgi:AcrR family transcriptional regulator
MPKLKPEELQARRQEIIEAARTCFLRSGFHQTTTDEICREANITAGGLYHYFTSKDELIAAVIEHSATTAIARMRELIAEADSTESAFRQVATFLYQLLLDPDIDNATRLDIEIWGETLKNEKLAERNRTMWTMRLKWLEALIEQGLRDGLLDPEKVEPRARASLLIAVLIGLRTGRLILGPEFDAAGALLSLLAMDGARLETSQLELTSP